MKIPIYLILLLVNCVIFSCSEQKSEENPSNRKEIESRFKSKIDSISIDLIKTRKNALLELKQGKDGQLVKAEYGPIIEQQRSFIDSLTKSFQKQAMKFGYSKHEFKASMIYMQKQIKEARQMFLKMEKEGYPVENN